MTFATLPTPAVPRVSDSAAADRYIQFSLGDLHYALPISNVIESGHLIEVTPLPRVAPSIRGLIHLRGDLIPVLDLRLLLGLARPASHDSERMLVVRASAQAPLCVLAVDEIRGLIAIRPSQIVSGYCDRSGLRIQLLELDRVLQSLSATQV